jgi:hypothetical protein
MKAAILYSADSVPVYADFEEPAAAEGSQIVELVAATRSSPSFPA